MSLILADVEAKILARLNASPIVPAAQGAYNTVSPNDVQIAIGSKPYVVFTLVSGTYADSTFEKNVATAVYQVSIFDHRGNGSVNLYDVAGKVFGDSSGTDNAPTYGLARWKITGMTNVEDCMVEHVDFMTQHEPDALHYWHTFRVTATEK